MARTVIVTPRPPSFWCAMSKTVAAPGGGRPGVGGHQGGTIGREISLEILGETRRSYGRAHGRDVGAGPPGAEEGLAHEGAPDVGSRAHGRHSHGHAAAGSGGWRAHERWHPTPDPRRGFLSAREGAGHTPRTPTAVPTAYPAARAGTA